MSRSDAAAHGDPVSEMTAEAAFGEVSLVQIGGLTAHES